MKAKHNYSTINTLYTGNSCYQQHVWSQNKGSIAGIFFKILPAYHSHGGEVIFLFAGLLLSQHMQPGTSIFLRSHVASSPCCSGFQARWGAGLILSSLRAGVRLSSLRAGVRKENCLESSGHVCWRRSLSVWGFFPLLTLGSSLWSCFTSAMMFTAISF